MLRTHSLKRLNITAALVLGMLLLFIAPLKAFANPYKQDRKADALKDRRTSILGLRKAPTSARAHRKAVLEALERESGRDRAKKGEAVLRVPPRKKAERTNIGFQ